MADQITKKLWIFAGEASGDIYGASLALEAQKQADEAGMKLEIAGMGGPEMAKANVKILVDSTELGVMGFVEVLKLIFTFIGIFRKLMKLAKKERPDAVVLIDYPGFNLASAIALSRLKIPVIWYVSPQLWVWGKWRKPILEKLCSKMLVIFPFETEVYNPEKLDTEFVGHPLLEIVAKRHDPTIIRDPNCFLLLPGSRKMEVARLLEPMLDTVLVLHAKHPNLYFVISAPRAKMQQLCLEILAKFRKTHPALPEIQVTCGDTAYYQQKAATGLAASGTVTVESAIAGLPLVVAYKMNPVTILAASLVVKLYRGYFTMVNIIANKTVFEEFLQWHVNPKELVPAIEKILPGGPRRQEVEAQIEELVHQLSSEGKTPSASAAEACLKLLNSRLCKFS